VGRVVRYQSDSLRSYTGYVNGYDKALRTLRELTNQSNAFRLHIQVNPRCQSAPPLPVICMARRRDSLTPL
jgi:hypothetical protein